MIMCNELDKLKIKFAETSLQLEVAQKIYKEARNDLIEKINQDRKNDREKDNKTDA